MCSHPTLLGASGHNAPHEFFGLSSPSQLAQPLGTQASLAVAAADPTQRAASAYFGVASAAELNSDLYKREVPTWRDFIEKGEPNADAAKPKVLMDLTAHASHLHKLKEAAELGHLVQETTEAIQKSERPPTEAVVCEVAGKIVQKGTDMVGKAILLGAAELIVKEALAFPPAALAIPIYGATLPQAYANVEAAAEHANEMTKAHCHLLFQGEP